MTPLAVYGPAGPVTIARVDRGGPAATSGLQAGDELRKIGGTSIERPLDVERALLGRGVGQKVPVVVARDGVEVELDLAVADRTGRSATIAASSPTTPTGPANGGRTPFQDSTWSTFGLVLAEEPASTLRNRGLPLSGGMRVVSVKPGSSAATQGVMAGDILVQIHRWYTTSEQDVRYILSRSEQIAKLGTVRFDIIRGSERFFGQLALNSGESTRR
jgi:S1-C subfamily serine protease